MSQEGNEANRNNGFFPDPALAILGDEYKLLNRKRPPKGNDKPPAGSELLY
jgi:hypothetical protein